MAALVLIGLDVALTAPSSRITSLLALPAGWLAEWMDPGRPLIGPGHLATSASSPPPSALDRLGQGALITGLSNPITAPLTVGGLIASHR